MRRRRPILRRNVKTLPSNFSGQAAPRPARRCRVVVEPDYFLLSPGRSVIARLSSPSRVCWNRSNSQPRRPTSPRRRSQQRRCRNRPPEQSNPTASANPPSAADDPAVIAAWYVQGDRTDTHLAQSRASRRPVKSLSVTADESDRELGDQESGIRVEWPSSWLLAEVVAPIACVACPAQRSLGPGGRHPAQSGPAPLVARHRLSKRDALGRLRGDGCGLRARQAVLPQRQSSGQQRPSPQHFHPLEQQEPTPQQSSAF